jgi:hypothetical protein
VAEGVGLRCDPAFAFSEEDQFREREAPSQGKY